MTNLLKNKRIILGVTGSIACYKSADLASKLHQAGAQVDVILTRAAANFITSLTFQSVTGRRAYSEADLWGAEGHVLHIGLGKDADLLVIAPVTANTMAKLAHGQADNLLTLAVLAAECPLLLAPAMDGGMFKHAATQANLETLRERGAIIVGPASGHLASGMEAIGRMLEPQELLGHIRLALGRGGPLQGRRVVVTAGGAQEAIDPVRYIANRSSGKQGFALAQTALDLGADVTLISAPTHLETPVGAQRMDVRSTGEMLAAVLDASQKADVLLMAAAAADFQPVETAENKIKKAQGILEVKLEETRDILVEVSKRKTKNGYPRVVVGFAAESQNLIENAEKKLKSKQLDIIAANDISAADAGFAVDTNRITLLHASGEKEELPLMSKDEVAGVVLERVIKLLD
ncbi:MAG: bifunctional phosphopantothenoylcysteine decarboxylase/phosphopantothenate--cysteine ligase CoaBC [Chloroflexi bacterium]|nr:bifunctional phosphopantothenoylcysteine decarboxylase/phosphopantothenate--cysteine ligase CoaBC [Chloroflexota bacterium]